MPRNPLIQSLLAVVPVLIVAAGGGCSDPAVGCTTVVAPSGNSDTDHANLQSAMDKAQVGNVICLKPGTFSLKAQIDLAVSNVTLRSTSDGIATLDFKGQTSGSNGLALTATDGFTLKNINVKNSPGDAVRVTQGDRITFDTVNVTWDAGALTSNGAYGLYPVQCSHVLIDHCTVSYAADAGIYVGQSKQIIVRNSEAFGNVAGIEIENSDDAEVHDNYAHDNTSGILVFNLPDLDMIGGGRTNVHNNRSLHNNGANFASMSSIVSIVPSGTGFLIMAEDNGEFHNNTIADNESAGIAVVSFLVTGRPVAAGSKYDMFPEGNYIHDNSLANNGTQPEGLAFQIAIGSGRTTVAELVWDGVFDPKKDNSKGSLTNCFKNNGSADFLNLGLDAMGNPHPSTDPAPNTCSHDPLPATSF